MSHHYMAINPFLILLILILDGAFRDRKAAGITKMDNMYLGDAFKSFQQLQEEFNLSRTHFYRLLTSTLFHITKVAESLIFLIVLSQKQQLLIRK